MSDTTRFHLVRFRASHEEPPSLNSAIAPGATLGILSIPITPTDATLQSSPNAGSGTPEVPIGARPGRRALVVLACGSVRRMGPPNLGGGALLAHTGGSDLAALVGPRRYERPLLATSLPAATKRLLTPLGIRVSVRTSPGAFLLTLVDINISI